MIRKSFVSVRIWVNRPKTPRRGAGLAAFFTAIVSRPACSVVSVLPSKMPWPSRGAAATV
jgi:hypothetical protein